MKGGTINFLYVFYTFVIASAIFVRTDDFFVIILFGPAQLRVTTKSRSVDLYTVPCVRASGNSYATPLYSAFITQVIMSKPRNKNP